MKRLLLIAVVAASIVTGVDAQTPPLLAQHDWVHVLADYGTTVELFEDGGSRGTIAASNLPGGDGVALGVRLPLAWK